jgi:hypothetical protein
MFFKHLRVHRDSNFESGSVWAHSLTLSHTLGSVNVTPELHSWLAPSMPLPWLQA